MMIDCGVEEKRIFLDTDGEGRLDVIENAIFASKTFLVVVTPNIWLQRLPSIEMCCAFENNVPIVVLDCADRTKTNGSYNRSSTNELAVSGNGGRLNRKVGDCVTVQYGRDLSRIGVDVNGNLQTAYDAIHELEWQNIDRSKDYGQQCQGISELIATTVSGQGKTLTVNVVAKAPYAFKFESRDRSHVKPGTIAVFAHTNSPEAMSSGFLIARRLTQMDLPAALVTVPDLKALSKGEKFEIKDFNADFALDEIHAANAIIVQEKFRKNIKNQ